MPLPSLSTGLQMMNVAPAWQYVLKAIVLQHWQMSISNEKVK
jgi:predicted ABC-type sugar transport system permease subunit